jgi:hypothetical protein
MYCLNEKYRDDKSLKLKMEFCFNPGCSWPNQMAERSKIFYCTRCYTTNYCSIECQKADWKRLKVDCDVRFGKSIKEATYCRQRRQAKHNDSQLLLHKSHGIFLTLLKTVVRWKKHLRRSLSLSLLLLL